MKPVFGLDFGTTNSALSINYNGKIEIIDIDKHNTTGKTLRSIIYFDEENNIFVGQEAIERYIDNGAIGRFLQSIESFLSSKQFIDTYINRKRYELEDLIAIILRRIKKIGEEYVKQEVDSVVLGRPVVFSKDSSKDILAQERLKRSAEKAGFKNIKFQFEPVAAAFTFEKTINRKDERNILIGDFGGGTSDFTVLRLKSGLSETTNRKNDILSLGGIYIGGDKFDSQIMFEKVVKYFGKGIKYKSMTGNWLEIPNHIFQNLCEWHTIFQLKEKGIREYIRKIKLTAKKDVELIVNLENLIENNYGFMLFQSIEKAKIDLSVYESSKIFFKERKLLINEDITKIEFDYIIKDDVFKIEQCIESVLLQSGLNEKNIDLVFLTGGSSYIPCIKQIFIEKFGLEKIKQMDAFTSVAYGLGISSLYSFD